MDPGPFFYIHIIVYFLQVLFTILQTNIFYQTIRLILCLQQTGETDNLTASWGKVLWLCAGSTLLLAQSYAQIGAINKLSGVIAKSVSINLRKWFLSPTGSIKPWFHNEGNLPLCSSYLPLGFPIGWLAPTIIPHHGPSWFAQLALGPLRLLIFLYFLKNDLVKSWIH
jgi:hypothetical protein